MKTTLLALLALFCITFAASAADVTGKWAGEITTGRGPQPFTLELKQAGTAVTGAVTGGRGGDLMITDGKIDGDTVTFSTSAPGRDGNPQVLKYTGKVGADGSIAFTREGGRGPATFTVKKQ
jgi:hypothetical protein